jgi:nicotinate-nucleotide adenylyltransferase
MSLATIAVFERATTSFNSIGITLARLPGRERMRLLQMPRIDISSTMVRRRAAAGKPIRYLVPDKVANFIGAQSLYGAGTPAATTAGAEA